MVAHDPAVDRPTITVTGTAQQRAWRDRVLPPVERVRPGVWSVPTPFPGNPLRYVLAYLIETRAGLVLVDTGWPSEAGWDGLVRGIGQTGHDLTEVDAVVVTHYHGDHYGLAHRVRAESGARVALHTLDAKAARAFETFGHYAAAEATWLRARGVPEGDLVDLLPVGDGPIDFHGEVDVLLEDGDRPMGPGTPLRVIWTPGHTPGHICLAHEEHDLLLTGDHVLPRISPNISPSPIGEGDILGDYLGSLTAMADLDVAEVLPAHEYRFAGLPARIGQLRDHHAHRLAEVLDVVAGEDGPTTLRVAERLTWSRPWAQNRGLIRRSAIGETYAHLLHLERLGQVKTDPGPVDAWRAGR